MSINPRPAIYRSATPYAIVGNGGKAIEFYKRAFGATEFVRLADAGGKVMHAELRIGGSPFMLADEFPDMGYKSPETLGGSSVSMLLYVEDVDSFFANAVSAGAKPTMLPIDQFDGDRRGTITDPFGHVWLLASRKEDLSAEEIAARFERMMSGGGV